MTTRKTTGPALALAILGLAGVCGSQIGSTAAFAQDPQMQGDQGAPPPQGGGGFGGGRRGQFGGGRMPFAMGTVTAVDPTAKTITIAPQFGGGANQTIQVSDTAKVVSQATASVADLKTGDQVQVQGIPTGITASSLTIGTSPLTAGGPGGGRQGGGGQPGFGGGGQGRAGGGPGGQAAFAQATGTVTSTSPLTISLATGVSLVLKMDASAKISKFTPVDLSSIKIGDKIVSTGQAGDNGTFTASSVGVNMQMGGAQGGFGGRGGFGQGGGRGRRGGQAGGQGGFGAQGGGGGQDGMPAPPPPDQGGNNQ